MISIRKAALRAATLLGTIFFWAISIVKWCVTWIGATTVGDDFHQLLERLPVWAEWLIKIQPWLVNSCAIILTIFLIWLSWPEKHSYGEVSAATAAASPTSRTKPQPALELVRDRHFFNERIILDNKHFLRCNFVNTTLVFNGAATALEENVFDGSIIWDSDNTEIKRFYTILYQLGMLKLQGYDSNGIVSITGLRNNPKSPGKNL